MTWQDEKLRKLHTRQRLMASLIAHGDTNKQIAERMGISVKTVEATLFRIYNIIEIPEWANKRVYLAKLVWDETNVEPDRRICANVISR